MQSFHTKVKQVYESNSLYITATMEIIALHLILIFLFHFMAQPTNAKVDKRDLEEYSWALFENPRFPGDIFFLCETTSRLGAVLSLNDQHRPQRWGFVIIRTVVPSLTSNLITLFT